MPQCKECVKVGNTGYKIFEGETRYTMAGIIRYFDEFSNFHVHDHNIYTISYSCTNGHRWEEKIKRKCKACIKENVECKTTKGCSINETQ